MEIISLWIRTSSALRHTQYAGQLHHQLSHHIVDFIGRSRKLQRCSYQSGYLVNLDRKSSL